MDYQHDLEIKLRAILWKNKLEELLSSDLKMLEKERRFEDDIGGVAVEVIKADLGKFESRSEDIEAEASKSENEELSDRIDMIIQAQAQVKKKLNNEPSPKLVAGWKKFLITEANHVISLERRLSVAEDLKSRSEEISELIRSMVKQLKTMEKYVADKAEATSIDSSLVSDFSQKSSNSSVGEGNHQPSFYVFDGIGVVNETYHGNSKFLHYQEGVVSPRNDYSRILYDRGKKFGLSVLVDKYLDDYVSELNSENGYCLYLLIVELSEFLCVSSGASYTRMLFDPGKVFVDSGRSSYKFNPEICASHLLILMGGYAETFVNKLSKDLCVKLILQIAREKEFGILRWSVHRNEVYVLIEEWTHEELIFSFHHILLCSATHDSELDHVLKQVYNPASVYSAQAVSLLKPYVYSIVKIPLMLGLLYQSSPRVLLSRMVFTAFLFKLRSMENICGCIRIFIEIMEASSCMGYGSNGWSLHWKTFLVRVVGIKMMLVVVNSGYPLKVIVYQLQKWGLAYESEKICRTVAIKSTPTITDGVVQVACDFQVKNQQKERRQRQNPHVLEVFFLYRMEPVHRIVGHVLNAKTAPSNIRYLNIAFVLWAAKEGSSTPLQLSDFYRPKKDSSRMSAIRRGTLNKVIEAEVKGCGTLMGVRRVQNWVKSSELVHLNALFHHQLQPMDDCGTTDCDYPHNLSLFESVGATTLWNEGYLILMANQHYSSRLFSHQASVCSANGGRANYFIMVIWVHCMLKLEGSVKHFNILECQKVKDFNLVATNLKHTKTSPMETPKVLELQDSHEEVVLRKVPEQETPLMFEEQRYAYNYDDSICTTIILKSWWSLCDPGSSILLASCNVCQLVSVIYATYEEPPHEFNFISSILEDKDDLKSGYLSCPNWRQTFLG